LWYEEYEASRSRAHVIICFFVFLEAPHDVFHGMWTGQNKTQTSGKCLCFVGCMWRVVFLLFLYCFCFCQFSVDPVTQYVCTFVVA
jgi:hypothetical protein